MLRYLFIFLIAVHGVIHLMGFVKAFEFAEIKELTLPISKNAGVFWLIAFFAFLLTGVVYVLKSNSWWVIGISAVILSQILVFYFWHDAKFGTIANVIILLVAIVGLGSWSFEGSYKRDVAEALRYTNTSQDELVTLTDLQHLPPPVQRYLNYVGVVGKPKIQNFKVEMQGKMRGKDQAWFHFTSEQYNFFDKPKRLFFMKAKVKGLPTHGYHCFKNSQATMLIKLLSLIPVVDIGGREMNESETVTFFNDLCLFAPAMLTDKNIEWESIDYSSAKATFTLKNITISAILYFNEDGQLINFESDDRYEASEMRKYRFSTPISSYQKIGDYNICSYGEAVWHYPEGKFVYGTFNIEKVEYDLPLE